MTKNISNTDDIIDVRDIIARVEELEDLHECAESEAIENGEKWITPADEALELASLKDLLDDLKGNGGDEQWRGDWYPITLIRDSHFEDAMDELLEDCGDLPKNLPCYLSITVDYTALQQDYASCEYEGVTYWYR